MNHKILFLFIFCAFFVGKLYAQTSEQDELLQRTNKLIGDGKLQEAYNLVNFAIKEYPKTPEFYVLRANTVTDIKEVSRQGKSKVPDKAYESAVIDLAKAFEMGYDEADFYHKMAVLHKTYQQYDKALEMAKKNYALIKDSKEPEKISDILRFIASIYDILENVEEALKYSKESLYVHATANAYSELSLIYTSLKDYEKAFQTYKEGLKKFPDNAYILTNYGYTCTLAGNYKKAIKIYDKLLANTKDIPELGNKGYYYNNRGYAKMQLGKLKEAMIDINASFVHYPENSYAFRNRGLLYLKMKKKDLACQDFQTAEKFGFSKTYGNEVLKLLSEHCK